MKHKVKSIHFVGIGGSGMSGIAEVLHNLGFCVSGSDLRSSHSTERLRNLGIKIFIGHSGGNVEGADVLVVSTAVGKGNPEVEYAKKQSIPVVPRAAMLAELMRFKSGIAVAGTHGKTTTTSLVASILAEGGLDPTYVIGGRLESVGANAKLGAGDFIVAEADESDGSFLHLSPTMCVITNIDHDHLETYDHNFDRLIQAFNDFVSHIPFYGCAVMCIDDIGVRQLLPRLSRQVVTYGFSANSEVRALQASYSGGAMSFIVRRKLKAHKKEYPDLNIRLNCLGRHNVLNSLAAIAVATELGIGDDVICRALEKFQGVGRRMQHLGDVVLGGKTVKLIDDYGHHPNEVAPTLEAIREAYPDREITLVYQLHRFSRTRDCFDDFVRILSKVDSLILTEIYGAGELPIPGITADNLASSIQMTSKVKPICVKDFDELIEVLPEAITDRGVLVTMGAGSIVQVPALLATQLSTSRDDGVVGLPR